jgi:hypothetical protein
VRSIGLFLCICVSILYLVPQAPAAAQTHAFDKEKSAAILDDAAKSGVPLKAASTVQDSVSVTAVMLTQPAVRRIFGSEIAKDYVAVQLTISNKSEDAVFVLHSSYIDTSQWALGGGTKGFNVDGVGKDDARRAGSSPNRVASVESRIIRGQLLDAQQWSARNWTVRLLTVAGSLASGYSFSFKETGISKGIAAFNGSLVPGVAFAWPDGAVAQQNRISDFGYQTNKAIPKQSADIIVCFFPIDMFLSAPFRDVFLKSPGLFLSPYQILFTQENEPLRTVMGITPDILKVLRELHPCYSKIFEPKPNDSSGSPLLQAADQQIEQNCMGQFAAAKAPAPGQPDPLVILDYIGRFGVQNIGVYVDGSMTVDVDLVPAAVDQVVFTGDAAKADFWASLGEKKGKLQCRFCTGGQVSILEAQSLGITDVTTITDGSDERNLNFSFKLTKPIETGQTLTFIITKKPSDPKKGNQEIKSTPFTYSVNYPAATPSVTKVTVQDGKVTVTGTGFFNTKANPLGVLLRADGGKEKDVPVVLPDGEAADKLTFDVPASLPPGCWNVRVKLNQTEAPAPSQSSDKVLSAANPKLTEAKRTGASLAIKGDQLVDTSACGGKNLTFQVLKTGDTSEKSLKSVTASLNSVSEATLVLPAEAETGAWTVRVLQGTDVKSSVPLN